MTCNSIIPIINLIGLISVLYCLMNAIDFLSTSFYQMRKEKISLRRESGLSDTPNMSEFSIYLSSTKTKHGGLLYATFYAGIFIYTHILTKPKTLFIASVALWGATAKLALHICI